MAKHQKSIRGSNIVSNRGQNAQFEHQESIDDSLLPDAIELARLKELDPDVINWIKERTVKEQEARHDFNDRKMKLMEGVQSKIFVLDLFSLVFAFLIIMAGMLFSYYLIKSQQVITGTVFAGATIIFAANAFLNFRKKNQAPPKEK